MCSRLSGGLAAILNVSGVWWRSPHSELWLHKCRTFPSSVKWDPIWFSLSCYVFFLFFSSLSAVQDRITFTKYGSYTYIWIWIWNPIGPGFLRWVLHLLWAYEILQKLRCHSVNLLHTRVNGGNLLHEWDRIYSPCQQSSAQMWCSHVSSW